MIVRAASRKRNRKDRVLVRSREPGRSGERPSIGSLAAAIDFIRAVGGLDAAKQALSEIEAIKRINP
jgi:hypothetical protein